MNKEILQNYNTRLDANNTSLDNILNVVNELPEIVKPKLQDKSVTIIENGTQNIVADDGFDGMNSVAVTTNVEPDTSDATATQNCTILKTVNLPDTVIEIGSNAFDSNTNLEMSELPSGLETLGSYAFQNCQNVTFSKIPEGLKTTQMPNSCFAGCSKITISKLPLTMNQFYMSGFRGCTSITEFEFHENFRGFGSGNNFYGCTSLKVLKFKCTTPPQLGNINNFTNCPLERIEVPVGCLEAYQTATNWTNYAHLMVEV